MQDVTTLPSAERGHDEYSASKSHRWLACPGSVNLCRGMPDKSGAAADRGTRIHHYAELFELGKPLEQIQGTTQEQYDEETDIAKKFVAKAREIEAELAPNGFLALETAVDLRHLGIMKPGHADRMMFGDDIAVVQDYKGGRVFVPAVGNPQGAIYGSGASRMAGVRRVAFVIIQMGHNGEAEARVWILEPEDLEAWESFIAARRRIAETSEVLIPGEHCMYCPAKRLAKCPALSSALLVPHDMESWAVYWAGLTIEQQGQILNTVDQAVKLGEQILDHAKEGAQATGVCPTGWRMQKGRTARYWADPLAAEAALTQAVDELGLEASAIWEPRELRSVSSIEKSKAIPKDRWGHLVGEKTGNPSLVPAASKKPGKVEAITAEPQEA